MQRCRIFFVLAVLTFALVIGSASVVAARAGEDPNPPGSAPNSRSTGQEVTTQGHPNPAPIGNRRDPQSPALPEAPVTVLLPVICAIAAVGTLYAVNVRRRLRGSIAE
jgi:hypothetical protein